MGRVFLGDVLKQKGYITQEQLDEALELQHTPEYNRIKLGEILVKRGYINSDQLLEGIADRTGYTVLNLREYRINESAVYKIPRQIAVTNSVIAVGYEEDGELIVSLSDPSDLSVIENIKSIVKQPIKFVVSRKEDIDRFINTYYSEKNVQDAASKASAAISIDEIVKTAEDSVEDSAPIVALVNSILLKGYTSGASDIHIEPFEHETQVRLRIDGQLIDYLKVSIRLHESLVTRIKVMSDLDIAEKRIPQDGHTKVNIDRYLMNIRVSTLPMIYGEKVVMRFLNSETKLDNSETFGMNPYNFAKIDRIMKHPNGVIYITGPTGSGKTTTLYMMLEKIAQGNINVSTIEDPVERPIARINQTQVNNQAGMTFAIGLRALLRQDPDVILVGETRDGETASIGVTAAITGHLVLSTLHTNDAISSISRLEDMGVEHYLLASAVKGIVAQRLMKKICPKCRKAYKPTPEDLMILHKTEEEVPVLYKGTGCEHCNGTGYKGRVSIHEVLEIDEDIRKMISNKVSLDVIYKYVADNEKMHDLRHEAVDLCMQGMTTVDEVVKVAYVD